MSQLLTEIRSDYDRATTRAIRVAFVISVLLHAIVMWQWLPRLHLLSLENPAQEVENGRLQVQLVPWQSPKPTTPPSPPPAPPSAPAIRAEPPPVQRTPPPKARPRRPSKPPVIALNRPAPEKTPAPPAPAPAPSIAAPPPPVAGDLSSYIEARRRARGEPAPVPPPDQASATASIESEEDRRNRIVAANLGLNRAPRFGYNPDAVGGIFEIKRLGYDDAEFLFFGWNRDIRRNTEQLIEVRKGNDSSIQIAVVRRMIEIIQQNVDGDFLWVSHRLDRNITLSARPRDTAGLEAFLMQEFFDNPRRP